MSLRLDLVTPENSADLIAVAHEYADAGEQALCDGLENPDRYFDRIRRFREGVDLPPDRVQGFEYWLLDDFRILGNCRIRRVLIPKIELDGGNISYDIRPSERGRGYGREILRLALDECRKFGLSRVLLTTHPENEGSIRVIRANGGIELDRTISPFSSEELIRWQVSL